jgi:membrane protein
MAVLRFLGEVVVAFRRHGCASLAASLAFFSLLALFPLVFLLQYGISFLVSQEVLGEGFLLSFLKGFLPTLGEGLAHQIRRAGELETVRWVVFLTFAWLGTSVFYELDYAIHVVFGTSALRHTLISTAVAVVLLGAFGVLLVASYVATYMIEFLISNTPHLWGLDLVAVSAHGFLLTYTLPFLLALATVTTVYRSLPLQRPSWRDAAIGATVFALLWVAAKYLFAAYSQQATVYSRLYGTLLEVVLLLLWIYYSSLLMLLGAVVTRRLQLRGRTTMSP